MPQTTEPLTNTPDVHDEHDRKPSRAWVWWLVAAAVVAALAFVKIKYFPSQSAEGGKGGGKGGAAGGPGAKGGPGGGRGGAGGGGPLPVQVYVVTPTKLTDAVAATGSVLADEQVTVRSEINGRITSLNFKEGQPVSKGQLLLTINADEIQAQLQKLRYNLKLFRDQERRQRTLLEKEYISQQEYEQSNNQVLTAQADLQLLEANLAKAYIRAPFSGVVGLRSVSVGGYVTPNTPVTTLSRISPVKVDFAVPGRYANAVKVGDEVVVNDEATNKKYEARVYAINPQIDPASRTLSVRAVYPNSKQELRPGAFVRVNLNIGQVDEAIQIPTEAVSPEASGYRVYKVVGGKAQPQQVKIGIRSEKLLQITDGLAPGDTIMRTGILQVKPGDKVKVQKPAR
ncbi:efflux RND transporter periplasmic adaptor subunit [Hymenobacter busanensis]|uniref:Efflux RND transporter periplasmic adaptor subunit n=1 Tax=Hymenobacter busanensis TaxID=2607656 RepID=A0A7L4ZWQ2_9BACT|nr:efflux RND transporter periplasmic adaptor subunit [Hymenobacter busanensis]KAA9332388.1 efflux RND transporter periplasmic adaptor subunit [Hymenobacter busanensis]QHJ07275.1 efflux RND transporter periplasmic adaptor subunit [Hymenobacter busanensis]